MWGRRPQSLRVLAAKELGSLFPQMSGRRVPIAHHGLLLDSSFSSKRWPSVSRRDLCTMYTVGSEKDREEAGEL